MPSQEYDKWTRRWYDFLAGSLTIMILGLLMFGYHEFFMDEEEPEEIVEDDGCDTVSTYNVSKEPTVLPPPKEIGYETYNNQTFKAVAIHEPVIIIPMDDYNTGKLDKTCHEWLHIKLKDKNSMEHFCE